MKTNFCIIIMVVCVFTLLSVTFCLAEDLNANKAGSILRTQSTQKKNYAVLKESNEPENWQSKKECLKNSDKTESFTGFWETNFADLRLFQTENKVTGDYNYKGGKIDGTVTGNRLDYFWSQEDGKKGKGYFIVTNSGQDIEGEYGYDDNSTSGGNWSGKKTGCPIISDSTINKGQ